MMLFSRYEHFQNAEWKWQKKNHTLDMKIYSETPEEESINEGISGEIWNNLLSTDLPNKKVLKVFV